MSEKQPADVVARCPVCATPVDEFARRCERCDTPHHPECWDYLGGCGMFGCARSEAARSFPSSSPSSLPSPSLSPPSLVSLAREMGDFIRHESQAVGVVSVGFLIGLLVPCLFFLAVYGLVVAVGAVSPGQGQALGLLLGSLGTEFTRLAFLVGLLAVAGGVLGYGVARVRHWLVERALTRALGSSPTLGARDRSLVLEHLDLDERDERVVARSRWAERASTVLGVLVLACLGVIMAAAYQVFQVDSRWAFELAMVAGTLLGPVLAAFVVVGLQADAGRHLVDLQVTLNRIEAADKGKG